MTPAADSSVADHTDREAQARARMAANAAAWRRLLPFADVATQELPLRRLLRLSLFQVSVGMAAVLLTGTLNRVMILDMRIPAWLVALMVSLPVVFAPLRALIGYKSDTHQSVFGWRRGVYIWYGSMLQFGGLAIMPFTLLLLSGETTGPAWIGHGLAVVAFLLVGAGLHTTQTAGLALANDLAAPEARPRVVALLYVTLLVGMLVSAVLFSLLLADFTQMKLIRVLQGAAVLTMVLNCVALWKQEGRHTHADAPEPEARFADAWNAFASKPTAARLLVAVGLGSAAFAMQDVLLEPYGGEILGLSVAATTLLTALWAAGALAGFGFAARRLSQGDDPHRLAAFGALIGVAAFSAIIVSDPLQSPLLFRVGAVLIGLGGGVFAVGVLTAAMDLASEGQSGMALGAWGAVQATAAGAAIALGGALRDIVSGLAEGGYLGEAFIIAGRSAGYSVVYHIEILLLFATLAAIGPLARLRGVSGEDRSRKFGLAEFPG